MSEDTKQPVVDDTKAPASPGAAVDSARNDGPDLDTLLADYDKQTTQAAPSPEPVKQQQVQTSQPDPLVAKLVNRFEREDIDKLVNEVKGDLDYEPEMVEAWIDARARKDPRLQRAWLEREANPQAFQRISKELGKEFAKRASKAPDKQATEDRELVAAAVRGASTQRAPETAPPDYSRKGNPDFRRDVIERYGYDPGV